MAVISFRGHAFPSTVLYSATHTRTLEKKLSGQEKMMKLLYQMPRTVTIQNLHLRFLAFSKQDFTRPSDHSGSVTCCSSHSSSHFYSLCIQIAYNLLHMQLILQLE